jgi:hypothetical protein
VSPLISLLFHLPLPFFQATVMLPYQQQQQQQQQQQPIDPNAPGHNLHGLGGFGFNNVNFGGSPDNFNGSMGLNDFALEQHGLGLPLSQASPASVLQTQGIVSSQQPQPFSPTGAAQQPQNLMMQNNTPGKTTPRHTK